MVCGNCGATIADKAIACYRCGAATAIPPVSRDREPLPAPRPWLIIAILCGVAAVLTWLALSGDGIEAPNHVGYLVLALLSALTAGYLAIRRAR